MEQPEDLNAPTTVPPPEDPAAEENKDLDEDDEKAKPMYERYEFLDPRKYCAVCTLKVAIINPPYTYLSKSEFQT